MMSPRTDRERKLVIETLKGIVEGLQRTIGRNVEVVLHDLSRPGHSVVAIANGQLTGRSVGSPIISGPFDDLALQRLMSGEDVVAGEAFSIVGDYRTRARSGRELDSTSIVLRDESGQAYAAFCINADRSKLRELETLVRSLVGSEALEPEPAAEGDAANVDGLVSEIIESGIAATGKAVAAMSREDKVEAVRYMNGRGLFLIRSSVDLVAASLGVSRFTIYNYLDEMKPNPSPEGPVRRKRKAHA